MKNLLKALFDFQQEVPIIHKGTENTFSKYSYADIATIIETIKPFLKKHRIGYTQPIQGNSIKTIIFHVESGETIESSIELSSKEVQLKGMNQFQVEGSEITYKRRYSLASILGLVTDKDTDAAGEPKKPMEDAKPQPQKSNKPVFDQKEFEKTKANVQMYINKGLSASDIKAKIEEKYSEVPVDVFLLITAMKPASNGKVTV